MKLVSAFLMLICIFCSCREAGSGRESGGESGGAKFTPWLLQRKEDACQFLEKSSLPQKTKKAYVLDAHDDDYALGALVSAASLRKFSQIDIVVLLSGNVTQKWVHLFEKIGVRYVFIKTDSLPNSKLQRYAYSMIKICTYNLTEYEKILFVDSDTLFYSNLDYLFDLEQDKYEIIGPSDFFERIFKNKTDFITTALFLVVPSEEIYFDLVWMSIEDPQDADMDLINLFFSDKKKTVIDVPFYLNWQFDWAGIPRQRFSDMKLIHFSHPNTKVSKNNQKHYADWRSTYEGIRNL